MESTKQLYLIVASAISSFIANSPARSEVIYNNINLYPHESDSILDFGPLADSFSTGASAQTLTSVSVKLQAPSCAPGCYPAPPASPASSVQVSLYSDNKTAPGQQLALIGSVLDSQLSGKPGDFTFNTLLTLTANTRYWIELSTSNYSWADWDYTNQQVGTGVAGEYFYFDGRTSSNLGGPYQMELIASAVSTVPLPASAPMFGAACLAFAAIGYGLKRRKEAAAA